MKFNKLKFLIPFLVLVLPSIKIYKTVPKKNNSKEEKNIKQSRTILHKYSYNDNTARFKLNASHASHSSHSSHSSHESGQHTSHYSGYSSCDGCENEINGVEEE